MLSSLLLENFRSLHRRQAIPLRPITLIFGANSAGKSSILDSLLLLKQTLSQAEATDSVFVPKGALLDLGSFREIVYGHDTARTVEIAPLVAFPDIPWRARRPQNPRRVLDPVPADAGLGVRYRYNEGDHTVRIEALNQYWGGTETPLVKAIPTIESPSMLEPPRAQSHVRALQAELTAGGVAPTIARLSEPDRSNPYWRVAYEATSASRQELASRLSGVIDSPRGQLPIRTDYSILVGLERAGGFETDGPKRGLIAHVPELVKLAGEVLAKVSSYNLDAFITDITTGTELTRLVLRNFSVFDTLRVDAPEMRPGGSNRSLSRIFDIEGMDLGLLCSSVSLETRRILNRMLYLGPLREYPERYYIFSGNVAVEVGKSGSLLPDMLYAREAIVERLNHYLGKFETGYSVEVFRPNQTGLEGIFSLQFMDSKTGTAVSIRDVGFGLSQVIPVIVQSALSQNRTILIEQPEIHLHPRLQADLGTLFAESISPQRSNQFIIETHSEHLILRLQRLIRTKALKSSDLSVIYVTKGSDGSECHALRMDERGDFIDRWPEGFFEEGFREIFHDE